MNYARDPADQLAAAPEAEVNPSGEGFGTMRTMGAVLGLVLLSATTAMAAYTGPGQQCDSQDTEKDAKYALANSPGGRRTGIEIVEFQNVVDTTGQIAGSALLSCAATVLINDGSAHHFTYQYELTQLSPAHVVMRVFLGGGIPSTRRR